MPQEVNSVPPNLALGEVDDQSVLLQSPKEGLKVLFVSIYILAYYQDVVYIYKHKIQTRTDSVHEALESLGRVLKPEQHPEKFRVRKG